MPLLLLPNLLGEGQPPELFLPKSVGDAVRTLQGLIAESEKGGRAFLRLFGVRDLPTKILDEHTAEKEIGDLLAPVLKGERWGVVSDCGLPCLADPGSALVLRARQSGIPVSAFVGPSSITLGLMLSGLPAQRFCFRGYLPRDDESLKKEICALERRAQQEGETQLFIEAPYRNEKLFAKLLENLNEKTLFCVACDLTLPTENVMTKSVGAWKKNALPSLHKRPTLFLLR